MTICEGIRKAANGEGHSVCDAEFLIVSGDSENRVYLAPSDSFWDFLTSFRTNLVDFPFGHGGRVHAGYLLTALAIWNSRYFDTIREGFPIRFYGHSYGGALAGVLSAIASNLEYTVLELTTLGAPAWAENGFPWPSVPGERYVCGWDIVPLIWAPYLTHDRRSAQILAPCLPGPWNHMLSNYEISLGGKNGSIYSKS